MPLEYAIKERSKHLAQFLGEKSILILDLFLKTLKVTYKDTSSTGKNSKLYVRKREETKGKQ